MIRLGIVGCNYGRMVQLPAFRNDPRCEVVALAGSDQARTAKLARQSGIAAAFGDWQAMLEQADIDAVVIATVFAGLILVGNLSFPILIQLHVVDLECPHIQPTTAPCKA